MPTRTPSRAAPADRPEIGRRRREAHRVGHIRPGDCRHDRSQILDRAGQRPDMIGAEGLRDDAGGAHQPPARLEARNPAKGGGEADRSGSVAADRKGGQRRRDRRRRTARRTAGDAAQIVRVAGIRVDVLGGGAEREFMGVDLAEQYRPDGSKPRLHRRVRRRHPIRQDMRTGGRPNSGRLYDVLEAIRHAVQQTPPRSRGDLPIRRRRRPQRAIGGDRNKGFEARVQRRDAVEKGAGKTRRGDFAGADAPAEIDGTQPDQFVIGHLATPGVGPFRAPPGGGRAAPTPPRY